MLNWEGAYAGRRHGFSNGIQGYEPIIKFHEERRKEESDFSSPGRLLPFL